MSSTASRIARMPDQLVGPGEHQMRLAAQRASRSGPPSLRFGLLQLGAIGLRLVGGQRPHRKVIAVARERLDLRAA